MTTAQTNLHLLPPKSKLFCSSLHEDRFPGGQRPWAGDHVLLGAHDRGLHLREALRHQVAAPVQVSGSFLQSMPL